MRGDLEERGGGSHGDVGFLAALGQRVGQTGLGVGAPKGPGRGDAQASRAYAQEA